MTVSYFHFSVLPGTEDKNPQPENKDESESKEKSENKDESEKKDEEKQTETQ